MVNLSGPGLADRIAAEKIKNGKLSAETQKALDANKAESAKNQSIWNKKQQEKTEFGRGYQIELEKENRVKAGLPEYDIQQSNNPPKKTGRGKSTSAEEVKKRQQGSDAVGELRKESRSKALIAKAEHQAETQSASGKHIHNELKKAEELNPGSTKNINEKELIKKAGEDFKSTKDGIKNTADDTTKKITKIVDEKTTKKAGGLFSKLKIGKKTKWGLAIGAAIALGSYVINKLTGDNKAQSSAGAAQDTPTDGNSGVKPNPTEGTPADEAPATTPTPADETPADEAPATTPAPADETPVDEAPATTPAPADEAPNSTKKEHTVVPGDNVWNIAKQHLKDLSNDPNYKPTNAEILKHTKELMDLNQLKFEDDGYVVIIKPNDKLKLTA